jgi:subtilisin family serine protease
VTRFAALLTCLILFAAPIFVQAAEISPELDDLLALSAPGEMIRGYLRLNDQVDLVEMKAGWDATGATRAERHYQVITTCRELAEDSQRALRTYLEIETQEGRVYSYRPFWIENAIALQATAEVYEQLARHDHVARIDPDFELGLIAPVESAPAVRSSKGIEPGVEVTRAPELWDLGIDGTGIIAGDMDTGQDGNHPAFADRWRGLHADSAECWYDPAQSELFPHDYGSHGTHTLGTMIGDDGQGNQIGMAPKAEWIAAAVIDVPGANIVSEAIASFEWFADPDGDPTTLDDVPAVINNSWRMWANCGQEFWASMDVAEAAGVAVIFAAGNEGPRPGTIGNPPDRITTDFNAFAVGALKLNGTKIARFSSRGPSKCDNQTIKPEVVAVGDNVRSAIPDGNYSTMSGTSMAAPHVSGAIVLLRQAFPDATVDELKAALYYSAVDLGNLGEDNTFGNGRIDVMAAYLFLANECDRDGDGHEATSCGGDDCEDLNRDIYPGAPELCDGRDNNCAGSVPTEEIDHDSDGVRECEGDCEPENADVKPGKRELCNGYDDNCDGEMLEDEQDRDNDGVPKCKGDCEPDDADIFPGQTEFCNGYDDNCDGFFPDYERDLDGDGHLACVDDCNDHDGTMYPGAPEICDDLIDNNCNGVADSYDPECAQADDDDDNDTDLDDDDDDDAVEPDPVDDDSAAGAVEGGACGC